MALIWGRSVPRHVQDWADYLYDAWGGGKGLLLEAFRGSTKTTFGVSVLMHQIGLYPWKSNMLIQATDATAKKNAKAISKVIDENPKWKLIFPNVTQEKLRWSDRGYWAQDKSRRPEEWQALAGLDATFVGWGILSESIIGLHPTGVLVLDDLHNQTNTASPAEMQTVLDTLKGTIFPTLVPGARQLFIGTPWNTSDSIAYAKALPRRFKHARYPLFDKRGNSSWPEVFTSEEVQKRQEESGPLEFARMYLLDLEAAKGITLKREWIGMFPAADIKSEWPMFMGVDYASTADKLKDRDRDYFALAWGRVSPDRRLIIEDGWRGHVSQAEAEQRVIAMASAFPTLKMIGVEAIGRGEEFLHLLMRSQTYMPLIDIKHGNRSKGTRFEDFLAKLFYTGRIMVSDKTTEFTKVFLDEWVSWPRGDNDDTIDAVYMTAAAAATYGYIAAPPLQQPFKSPLWGNKPKKVNPYRELARA